MREYSNLIRSTPIVAPTAPLLRKSMFNLHKTRTKTKNKDTNNNKTRTRKRGHF